MTEAASLDRDRAIGPDLQQSSGAAAPERRDQPTEAEFRLLADNLPALAWMADADGYIFWYNRRWHEYCGTTDDEMRGWGWRSVHDPEVLPSVLARWTRSIATGAAFEMTFPLRGADGRFRPFLTRVEPVRDRNGPDGRILRWFGTNTDVSAQVEAENALRRERDRGRGILDTMAEGFTLLDRDFRVLAVNADAMGVDGRPAASLVGRLYWHAFPGIVRTTLGTMLERAMAGRVRTSIEFRRDAPCDAGVASAWFEIRAYPTEDGLAVFFRDVTDRKLAEGRLRELNLVLEERVLERTRERDQLWHAANDLLCVAALDGTMIAVNPAWTASLGWSSDQVETTPFVDLVHPDDRSAAKAALGALSTLDPNVRFDNRLRRSDGGHRWLSWNAVLRDRFVFIAGRDVTVEKEQEEARSQLEEQLRQSQKMEAVGQLTGGLAHDFNNLLTGIGGSLELMEARLAQNRHAELGRYLRTAQEASRRAASLTHRLLAFSRRQTLDPKPTDLNRMVAGMEELIRRTVGPAITVEVVAASGLWATLIDNGQIENTLLNLAINGRDAMPDGGTLTISTGNLSLDLRAAAARDLAPGDYVTLEVRDTGVGMDPETVARAFDPFFTTKPLGAGTGLGLSMVYGFVRQSGGRAAIASAPGAGTTLSLALPRHQPELAFVGDASQGGPAGHLEFTRTALVVDDEEPVRMLVGEVLGEQGYAVLTAADGHAALDLLRSDRRIDLLVSDVGLPGGLNGRQVADAARLSRPHLPILLITGYAEHLLPGGLELEGGMQVLTKPFTLAALSSRVADLVAAWDWPA